MPRSLLNSASNSSQRLRIFASVSGFMRRPFAPGTATSNRSSWRRIFSMKAKPSSYVIGRFVCANSMTVDVVMNTSSERGCQMSTVATPIMANLIDSAKQNTRDVESRQGQGCDIVASVLWRTGHSHEWYAGAFFTTTSRNFDCGSFAPALCTGDMSITLLTSTGWGSSGLPLARYSASEGRR
jgi:hypothetical protein